MTRILCIESSGDFGSAALFQNNDLVDHSISKEERSHSRLLATQIQTLVHNNGGFKNLDAIAVSAGPGSYTGLRIGISIAKGLCFSLELPLIAISTLEVIAMGSDKQRGEWIIPVLHARKNEVYAAAYNEDFQLQMEPQPLEVQSDSFSDLGNSQSLLFCGNGAPIVEQILINKHSRFQSDLHPTAELMGKIAFTKFSKNEFADLDNFEPEYLKPVYTTQPKPR